MYRNILKIITVFFVMLALFVPVTLEKLQAIYEKYDLAKALEDNVLQNYVKASSDAKQEKNPDEILQEEAGFEDDLRIELPDDSEGERQSISVETDALTQTVYVKLKADVDNYFTKYSMTGRSNHIDSMQYYRKGADGVIAITTDKLYQVKQRIENGYLYLSFVNLHDIYDKVIIIDAGHGGRMTGAVRNGIEEKNINLDIVLALKEQLDSYSGDKRLGIFYTRTTDTNPTLQQRAALANKADADLFISVHCNSYEKGNFTAVSGTQVLYSQSDNRELGSKHLAQICMDNVTAATGNRAFGLLPADDIYIIRTSEAPVALVEMGFMTNRQELDNLANADYQKQAAIYRHDLRHHMNFIQSCLNDNSYAQAQDYIREICTSLNNSQITRYCANEAVNLILSSYIAKADKYNITTQVSVTAANLAAYKPTDLCSLFANALENAINACKLVQTAKTSINNS